MNYKKIVFSLSFLVVFSFLSFAGIPSAKAVTVDELRVQIQALLQQVQQLQTQIAQLQGQPAQWCHDFKVNLKIEMGGNEVKALQTALEKEGFTISQDEKDNKKFGESTASTVTGFQQKYKDEILTPLGLQYGTGFVGNATRAKLNKLYGCGIVKPPTTTPSITILSPNGGETWKVGEIRTISWNTNPGAGADKIVKISIGVRLAGATTGTAFVWVAGKIDDIGSYSWAVPAVYAGLVPSNYIVEVYGLNSMGENVATGKSAPFTITSITTQPSITVLSPNGGEKWVVGKTYEINWKSSGIDKVYIRYEENPFLGEAVHTGLVVQDGISANLGKYSWTIPKNIFPSEYKISIQSSSPFGMGEKGYVDKSDNYFSIVSATITPSIAVLSPNGGEIVRKGDSQTIKWSQEGCAYVMADLMEGSNVIKQISVGNSALPGQFTWRIPSDIPDGKNYKIRLICSKEFYISTDIYDFSDAPFSIVAAGTGLNDIQIQLASMAEAVAKLAEEIKGIRQ